MKANEFVKKFGWDEAKEAIKNVAWCETAYCTRLGHGCFKTKSDCCIDINDLKRLIESHELVEKYESLDEAKAHLGRIRFCIATKTWFGKALLNWSMYADKLEQAIADVESCQ